MKRTKKILIVVAVAGCLIALMCALLFTTAEIPAFLVNSSASAGAPSREKYTALVLKWFRRETLTVGDLVVVEIRSDTVSTREVRMIERIQPPDESERQKVSRGRRHRTSRRIAQAILDMDFRPQYWVSAGDDTNSTGAIHITEDDIKGKVVHTFAK